MKKALEDLWYRRQMENTSKRGTEQEKILATLILNEEKLRENLNEELTELLNNYENCMNELNSISETQAFIEGVRFAATFLIEAIY
ncbi:MAG: hypothetical protein IJY27_08040 [Clostridia bacterium]|nr:hypothetical protein [Clostridia bacterium]